jgi:hypothetical protein
MPLTGVGIRIYLGGYRKLTLALRLALREAESGRVSVHLSLRLSTGMNLRLSIIVRLRGNHVSSRLEQMSRAVKVEHGD